ncbi:hypothetical protein L211DRAFT_848620 [Terfezia boudieri ATCC MYA-4762]|uniref:Uncharacterized protein n=1 Tax=Terfezia boudieri ATCC MYA-4762 TaxID=1051890 RepID=A0A3N4LPM0_9PEZI|nr:hypothetical protein L211DRAFT_848620 [Terfezia boudieri ATCC MYA-4762]
MAKKIRPPGRSAAPAGGATAVTSTVQTATIPTSAQQPRRNSCTRTTRRLRSSVGSEDGQRQGQSASVSASAQPASSIPSSAQQPPVTRRTHIGKHLLGPEGSQQESQPTGYHPGQLPKRRRISPSPGDSRPTNYLWRQIQQPPNPHSRPTKALQPSSSRSKNAQNNASPRRPAKHGPLSDHPRSSKRLRPTSSPTPIPPPPPPPPGVRLLIHTSAPSNAPQDALYRKQAVAVLRGFGAAAYMSLSSTSFEIPTYEDGESIPDRQADPRDAWMSTVGEELGTYDEDLEAMFRRYDKPRVVEAAKLEKKPQKEVKMKEDEEITESPPDVSLQVEDDGQQNAQRREKLPSLGSTQYSSLGFLLPDVESWEAPGGSIAESQAQDGNTVEVPSSPILPQNREDVNIDVEEMGLHIPSSQPGELAKGIAEASFPEILTGDLTSPEFLTFESVKGKRETQKGKGKGKDKDIREQAGLSSPAYQVLRESALNTPAPQRQGSSLDILSTPPPLQGNKRKQRSGRRCSDVSQGQAQARPAPRPPFHQSVQEAAPTPHSVAPSIRSQTTKEPPQEASTPPVRGSRIDKAQRSNTKGKSKSQITLNAPSLQLSQFKSGSQRTSGRYATRSYSQIEVQPRPPSSPSPFKKPQTPPPRCSSKRNREFFYAPSAPTPPSIYQHPPHSQPSSPSHTQSSLRTSAQTKSTRTRYR